MTAVMPDVAHSATAQTEGVLDWVGMNAIEFPLELACDSPQTVTVTANADIFVNLMDAKAKGIHMSRLYLLLDKLSLQGPVSLTSLRQMLEQAVITHQGLSDSAQVVLRFSLPLRRRSLKSDNAGWKSYPVTLTASLIQNNFEAQLQVEVPYSSTCPCSAALARQLIQQAFRQHFASTTQVDTAAVEAWLGTSQGVVATPHSQRSLAEVCVKLGSSCEQWPIVSLIDGIEDALQTPVQATVKREDEQEFALLNGQNLMFCEDAARRLQHALNQRQDISDFKLQVNHLESLHAHNAMAKAAKGIAGGYRV